MKARPVPDAGAGAVAQLRAPPADIDAEAGVLSTILMDNASWDQVRDVLGESDFLRHEHRLVYGAISALRRSGQPADPLTVHAHLVKLGKSVEVGGMPGVDALAQARFSPGSVSAYARIVLRKSVFRAVIRARDVGVAAAYREDETGVARAELEERLALSRLAGDQVLRRFAFRMAGDLLEHVQPTDWLVEGYLERNSLAMLFGEPAAGKSHLAIAIAAAVASGHTWDGIETRQGAVFFIAGEGHNGLARRLKAWELVNDCSLENAPLYVSERAAALIDEHSAQEVGEAVEHLVRTTGQQPALIVIDTLARNFGAADENSTADMGAFIGNVDRHLRARYGACVLIVHHSGLTDKTRARGAVALRAALDSEYRVQLEDGVIHLQPTKVKDGAVPRQLAFRLERVALPIVDAKGFPVHAVSPVATHVDTPSPRPAQGKAGRGKHQTTALQALADLEREHRDRLADAGQDSSTALVKVESWEHRLVRDGMDRRRLGEVRQSLIELGLVETLPGGYVRRASQ